MKLIKNIVLGLTIIFIISSSYNIVGQNLDADLDPLIDISVTVEIQQIRSLEKRDSKTKTVERIDLFSDPDFYVKVFINEEEFVSPIWHNTKYVYDPQWNATLNVPDNIENVDIKIQLWDWELLGDKICDISPYNYELPDNHEVDLIYSIKTGHWRGDDYCYDEQSWSDPSGYGRLNGCDDGSIYDLDRDCELLFDIYQNDYDNDGLPYWSEVEIYETNPEIPDIGDPDGDGVSIIWEHKWGHQFGWHGNHYWIYDPFSWENHSSQDIDQDGLDNYEEFLMSDWGSDPFRKDVFVELDYMESSPDGQLTYFPQTSMESLYTAFNRQNIVLHIDDGCIIECDIIPYDEESSNGELHDIYWEYFLHGDENNPRQGIFRYGVLVYWAGIEGHIFRTDAFQVSIKGLEEKKQQFPWLDRDVIYASAYMHELGHTFSFSPIPGHNNDCRAPWQIGWWLVRSYKSCMNYGYMYGLVDYSDGSRGKNDFDDWERMDLQSFQRTWD